MTEVGKFIISSKLGLGKLTNQGKVNLQVRIKIISKIGVVSFFPTAEEDLTEEENNKAFQVL